MALRSLWMAAWLMAGLKTQTFGPSAATFASGQIEAAAAAWGAAAACGAAAAWADAGAAWAGAAVAKPANPVPAARATATRAERHRPRAVKPLVLGLIIVTFAPQPFKGLPPRFSFPRLVTAHQSRY